MSVQLRDYQREAVESKKPFIFVAAGGGKTIIALTKVKPYIEQGLVENIFVVSTKAQVDVSVDHGMDWYSDYINVFDREPKICRFKTAKHLTNHTQYDMCFLTHHFGEMQKMIEAGVDLSRSIVIFDEVHKLKNPGEVKHTGQGIKVKNGKAGYYAGLLAKQSYGMIGLTATPSSGKWEDYANYLIMAGICEDFDEFKRLFCVIGDKEVAYGKVVRNQIIDYRNIPMLRKAIEKIGYRSKATEEYNGVDITEHYIDFMADKTALKQFTKDLQYYQYDCEEPLIAENNASILHYSKMIASGMNNEVSSKSKYVYDLLTEEKIGRTILFYNNNDEYDNIVRTIEKYNKLLKKNVTYKTINGKIKELDFVENLVDVLLVQYVAGGEGLNIKEYTNIIMFSPTYRYYSHKQALGRNNRVNQTKDITRYYLVNEIEAPIVESLRNKKDYDYTDKDTFNKYWMSIQ